MRIILFQGYSVIQIYSKLFSVQKKPAERHSEKWKCCYPLEWGRRKGSRLLAAATAAKSLQSYPTLCDPIDGSPPGSSVPGILQARTLEWVAISFSNVWKWKVKGKLLSRVRLLVTPWTAAYQGPPIHGIFQARVLEWGAIAFSEGVQRWVLISQLPRCSRRCFHLAKGR